MVQAVDERPGLNSLGSRVLADRRESITPGRAWEPDHSRASPSV